MYHYLFSPRPATAACLITAATCCRPVPAFDAAAWLPDDIMARFFQPT
jgi:hypothetical protein